MGIDVFARPRSQDRGALAGRGNFARLDDPRRQFDGGARYYAFEGNWLPVGRVSAFQLLVYAGAGVLMVNWLNEGPISKLVAVLAVVMVSSLLGFFYSRAGAFRLMRLDPVAHFVYYVAALSVYLWLALAFVGERTIYSSERTRRFILSD